MKPKCINVGKIAICSTSTGSGCGPCVPLGKSGLCYAKSCNK
jgi:hypothetical protein